MSTQTETERIARLEPLVLDGIAWYRFGDVCNALHVPVSRCYGIVPQEHKRRHFVFRRGYRSIVELLIDRKGVEQLVIKFCREPRGEIMRRLTVAT